MKYRPDMSDKSMCFIQHQRRFTANIRDPQNTPVPEDIEVRRMTIYQELVYNNIENFISSAFPVLRRISSDTYWHALVHKFIKHHRARTPLFHKLPQEFINFLEHHHHMDETDFPFLHELAHYEWVELMLGVAEDDVTHAERTNIDITDRILKLSPLARVFRYQYDVQHIDPDYLPKKPNATPTYLLVYRNRDDKVNFMAINPLTAFLLERLENNKLCTCKMLLKNIAAEIDHPNPQTVINGGVDILQDLFSRDALLIATWKIGD